MTTATGLPRDSKTLGEQLRVHVVMLTNFVTPYSLLAYKSLAQRVEKLTILVSTPMESNRSWEPKWDGLDVRVQQTVTLRRPWRHSAGFSDSLDIHFPRDTVRLLRELKPDVVVSGELGFRSLLSAFYATRVRRTPLILWATLSEHTEKGRGVLRFLLRRWLLARATCAIVNGKSGRRYLARLGFDPASAFSVPYSHPPGVFDQCPLERSEEKAHRMICVGQLTERKGVLPFMHALQRWAKKHPRRHVELDIVGSGVLATSLRSEQHPENLTVRFLGDIPYEELPGIYRNAGILAFPTLADEWGMVVNEAMASGLPVLGSLYSMAVEELCSDGENAWTFHPNSEDEMDRAIDQALSTSVEDLNRMRAIARQRVSNLTTEHSAELTVEVIRTAMESK